MSVAVPITAYFESATGVPLVAPANLPTVRIRRLTDNVLEITDVAMVEVGDGLFKYIFAPATDSIEYAARADGDPTAAGQVPAATRYHAGQLDNKLAEAWTRFDLDVNNPQTYENDGSIIANLQFTLTKASNAPACTFDINRT